MARAVTDVRPECPQMPPRSIAYAVFPLLATLAACASPRNLATTAAPGQDARVPRT
jgi:hypothetical protein